jgi:hypothetical protein
MSEFDAILGRGFAVLMTVSKPVSVTHKGVTKQCIGTPVAKSKAQKDAGYWLAFRTVCEFTRPDFLALQLADRSEVTVTSADGAKTIAAKVIGIEGEEDDGDPCVRVTLERGDAPPVAR